MNLYSIHVHVLINIYILVQHLISTVSRLCEDYNFGIIHLIHMKCIQNILHIHLSHLFSVFHDRYHVQRRRLQILKREVTELHCQEEKYQHLHEILTTAIESVGDEPPTGIDIADGSEAVSVNRHVQKEFSDPLLLFFRADNCCCMVC